MASSITISTGGLTSTLSTPDDASAQNVLLNFAEAIGIPTTATAQAKLDAVVAYISQQMVSAARERHFQASSAALRSQSDAAVHW